MDPSPRGALPIVLLPGLVAVCAFPWLWDVPHTEQAVLVAAQLLVCAAGVVSAFVHGLRPVRLVFFGFSFSWLGVGPLYQLSHRRLAWGDSALLDQRDLVTAALALTLIATLAVLVTSLVHDDRARSSRRLRPSVAVEVRPWAPWAHLGALLLLSPHVVASSGGLSALFTSRAARAAAFEAAGVSLAAGGGATLAVVALLPAALAVAAAHLFVRRIRDSARGRGWRRVRCRDAFGLAAALLGMTVFANPLSQTRFISVAAFGSVALALLAPRSRRAGQLSAGLLGVVVLGVYPLSALLGDAGRGGDGALDVFAGPEFDGFQQIVNTLLYVQDLGHSHGLYTVSALLFFVPRSVWAGKATPSSIDVAAHRDYWFTNLSMPIHSEFYLEFGVLGMLVAMSLLAVVSARIDGTWVRSPASLGAFVAPFLALAQLGVLRGPLGSLAPVWIPVLVLLVTGVRRVVPEDGTPAFPLRVPAGAGRGERTPEGVVL